MKILNAIKEILNKLSISYATSKFTRKSLNETFGASSNLGYGSKESGFIMPTVIILIVIMTSIAYATLLQANNSLNLSYKQSYIQMARTASKAAIDYAQEQFDSAACGAYSGTAETDLTGASNTRYRITMQAAVQSTSPDGYEKNIVGTGRVYLPKASVSALYVFDIRSEIVRTYAVCKTPDNFSPLVWLDASNVASLKKTSTSTLSPTTSFGSASDSTRDTLEERADNGAQTTASWQSNDFEMNTCDATEFSSGICNSNSTKYLYDGMIFSGVNVPKNATVTSATIQLACATPSGTSGQLNHRVYGFYKSAANPHPDLFSQTISNQLKTPLATSSLHTTSFVNSSSNNCPPGNNTIFNVTPVAQEIVNNANWDPAGGTNNGRMGFAFTRVSGSGSRHLLKNGNLLSISYSGAAVEQADNTDALGQWDDISGNGNNAKFVYGNAPTRQDGQINGKTVVRFNNGALVSSLTAALSGKREFTAFAVVKSDFGTSAASGRLISGMTTTGTSDTTGTNSIIPLRRQTSATGFSSYYANSSSYEVTMGCNPDCSSTPYLADSSFTIESSNDTVTGKLRGNGPTQTGQTLNINPGSPPPAYTFGIDQLYFGGRRTGAMPGSGTDYFNGDYAEIVIYDKALECRQIEDLEDYFRAKWAISPTQWTSTCPADTVPTL